MAVDPVAAVIAFLQADMAVSARVGVHVFGAEIPRDFNASMPTTAVVVRPAGGYGTFGRGSLPIGDPRLATDCYGATLYDSWLLHLDVLEAMKTLQRKTFAGVLLHVARVSAGGVTARDPITNWPLTIATYQMIASEIAA